MKDGRKPKRRWGDQMIKKVIDTSEKKYDLRKLFHGMSVIVIIMVLALPKPTPIDLRMMKR